MPAILEPAAMTFGPLSPHEQATRRFFVRANEAAVVSSVQFESGLASPFQVSLAGDRTGPLVGVQLAAGEALVADITFAPKVEGSFADTLVVQLSSFELRLFVEGKANQPFRLVPERLDFGVQVIGEAAPREVQIVNQSRTLDVLREVSLQGERFSILSRDLPRVLRPSETSSFLFEFSPEEEAIAQASVSFSFESGVEVSLNLRGEGTPFLPPIRCRPSTLPMGEVRRGRQSEAEFRCDVDGVSPGAVNFRAEGDPDFQLALRPGTDELLGQVRFVPSGPAGPRQTAFILEAGEVEASVLVEGTVLSPSPDQTDLVIELSWTEDVDLDLHLVREGGMPFVLQDDCHFASKRPSWDGQGDLDDPHLDRDERRGPGRELISLVEASGPYDVYVQLHDSEIEVASSLPTLRILGRATAQEVALSNRLEGCGAWWSVGRWNNGVWSTRNELSRAYEALASPQCP